MLVEHTHKHRNKDCHDSTRWCAARLTFNSPFPLLPSPPPIILRQSSHLFLLNEALALGSPNHIYAEVWIVQKLVDAVSETTKTSDTLHCAS